MKTIEELLQNTSPRPWKFSDRWLYTDADIDAMGEKEAKSLRKLQANRQLSDHCVNNFMKLLEALEMQKPEADYDSDDEMEQCIKARREALKAAKTLIDITSTPT